MLVEHILPRARERLVTIRDDAPVIEAAKLLSDGQVKLLVVCNGEGVMVGVVTKSDIVRQIGNCAGQGCTAALAVAMTTKSITCSPTTLLRNVWSTMQERHLSNLPVISQDHKPLGVVGARDVLLKLLEDVEYEESLLRDYVMGIGYH